MKMQTVLATVVFAGMASVSSLTYAEGELDNFWFNTRIKTTIKKNHGAEISGGFPPSSAVFNKNPIQFDSGKDNCYSALKWQGEHTRRYSLIAICKDSAGDFKNYTSPDEDVQSVEYDDGSILFIAPSVKTQEADSRCHKQGSLPILLLKALALAVPSISRQV